MTDRPGPLVLVVDDDQQICHLLERTLASAGFAAETFSTGESALDRVRSGEADLVLLDLKLPDQSGLDVLESVRADPSTRLLPVVMLTGQATEAERLRAQSAGVTDFVHKPFSPGELLPRLRALVALKQFADEHEHAEKVILTLAKMIDARDPHTAGHSGRVADYADRIAEHMGLDGPTRYEMRRGALFHDLGKIVIPDAILRKPGQLTVEERDVVQEHPVVGHDLLSSMKTMRQSLPIVYHHHERLDGSGYPDGISGSAIPMSIRIVTVADVFDALRSERSYRGARSTETAFEILRDGVERGWWDRDVVEAARRVFGSIGAERP
ncbi:MAG TPA: HD domain-containing phosphohydrolase [Thermoanaerobaculia bacterium]